MKRFLVIMMLGLLCLALVGGCGKKQEEAPAMEQPASPADTTVTTDTTITTTDTVSSTK